VGLSCIDGKCGKGLAAGAACKTTPSAKDPPCDTLSGLFCKAPSVSSLDGACTAFTTVAAGQACGVSLTPSVDYAFCTGAPDCQFPAKCRNGKCATLDPVACK